jgi:hypothetical protein
MPTKQQMPTNNSDNFVYSKFHKSLIFVTTMYLSMILLFLSIQDIVVFKWVKSFMKLWHNICLFLNRNKFKLFRRFKIMKRLILILSAAFILLPLNAIGDPDNQAASLTEQEQVMPQYENKSGTTDIPPIESSDNSSLQLQWEEFVKDMEIDKTKENNLEDTKEAVAEDIILN